MAESKSSAPSRDSEEDEDDRYIVRRCTADSRRAGKICISLYDCRYDIGMFISFSLKTHSQLNLI